MTTHDTFSPFGVMSSLVLRRQSDRKASISAPVLDVDEPLVVLRGAVAAAVPSTDERLGGRLRLTQVPQRDVRPADPELALMGQL